MDGNRLRRLAFQQEQPRCPAVPEVEQAAVAAAAAIARAIAELAPMGVGFATLMVRFEAPSRSHSRQAEVEVESKGSADATPLAELREPVCFAAAVTDLAAEWPAVPTEFVVSGVLRGTRQ